MMLPDEVYVADPSHDNIVILATEIFGLDYSGGRRGAGSRGSGSPGPCSGAATPSGASGAGPASGAGSSSNAGSPGTLANGPTTEDESNAPSSPVVEVVDELFEWDVEYAANDAINGGSEAEAVPSSHP